MYKLINSNLLLPLIFFIFFQPSIISRASNISGGKYNKVSTLQKSVDIIHYKIDLDLYTNQKVLVGDVRITAVADSSINQVELNLYDNLKVSEVLVNENIAAYSRNKNRIFISPENELKDTFTIQIRYSGTPKRGGFDGFVFGEINNRPLVYNISEPDYAPSWFPCDDDPSDKAMLEMKITNDTSCVSVSNGLLQSVQTYNDRKTFYFRTYYPISTYLIAVYSSPYVQFNQVYSSLDNTDSMLIEYYVMPEHLDKARSDFEDHPQMIKVFSELFGEYPFIKEKYGVAEFLWNFGAMENQTMTGIGYNFITGKKFFNDTFAHELAHHWWGNSVGPKSWDDVWLNEGFASYSEALYREKVYGKDAYNSWLLSKFDDSFSGTLYAPKDLFGSVVYDKGAWVLHLLRLETGDSSFFKILREYYNEFKYSNASTEDFKNCCQKISGKNLDKFFEQWVYEGAEIPFCQFAFTQDKSLPGNCSISINQIQNQYKEFHFPLDIQIIYSDNSTEIKKVYINLRESEFTFNIEKAVKEIRMDPDDKMLCVFEKR